MSDLTLSETKHDVIFVIYWEYGDTNWFAYVFVDKLENCCAVNDDVMAPRVHLNSPDHFTLFVENCKKKARKNIKHFVKKAHYVYFRMKLRGWDETLASHSDSFIYFEELR